MMRNLLLFSLFQFFLSSSAFAQKIKSEKSLNFFTDVLGYSGFLILIGTIFFVYSYKNSIKLLNWFEDQTYGTRDYILQKCELIHVEIEPMNVTYILIFLIFGPSFLVMSTFLLMGNVGLAIFAGVALGIGGWKIPRPFMNYLVDKRINAYKLQMVDALQLLSNGLRAGLSLPQSLGMVVDELPVPVSQEYNTILQQTKIGVPLEEAFENLVKRIPTQDNDMFVSAIGILKETGGNLSEVFDTIADVIRERVRLQQKIDTYVAQGKFQGITIFCMPFALGGVFAMSDPASMAPMFNTVLGLILFTAALFMDLLGLYFIFKVVKIEV
jgi:tight adherence protein B